MNINVLHHLVKFFSLICFNSVASDGFDVFIRLGFRPFLYEFADSFFIHGIGGILQQIRHDFSCCLAKRIRNNTGNADIGNGHTVLDAVLLGKISCDQLETVSRKFLELTEISWRDKGTSDKIKFVEVDNPFRSLFVRLLAFNGFDILWMCDADINVSFEIIKNRNPIFSGGFHTNMITIILDEPVVKPLNIRVDG